MTTTVIDPLEQDREKVLVHNNAQTIFDHMVDLYNKGGNHERRWFWELLQNAKDSVPEDSTVKIEVTFTDKEVVFKHNGNPFRNEDIIHLIHHGSTKKNEEGKTGKFGTGFMTTHLLSKTVQVAGILEDGKHFDFMLDRNGDNVEALNDSLKQSWLEFKESRTDKPNKDSDHYTTIFKYSLDEHGKEVAAKVIDELAKLLPYVLAINKKVAAVDVIANGQHYQVSRSNEITYSLSNEIRLVPITVQHEESKRTSIILLYEGKEVELLMPVERSETGSFRMAAVDPSIPRLFCDFPLFGTESFAFPVIINCGSFALQEARDGIFLGKNNTPDNNSNKEKIQDAHQSFTDLVQHFSNQKAEALYNITRIGFPPASDTHDESWYNEELQKLVHSLETIPMVSTESGDIKAINDIHIPLTENDHEQETETEDIWFLASELVPHLLPKKGELESWQKVIYSWGEIRKEDLVDLKYGLTLDNLCEFTFDDQAESNEWFMNFKALKAPFKWLNELLLFIAEVGSEELYREHPMLFNQEEKLVVLSGKLYSDEGINEDKEINKELKDIVEQAGIPIRSQLLHKKIRIAENQITPKSEEEVIRTALSEAAELARAGKVSPIATDPVVKLFAWLACNKRYDHLLSFPVHTRRPEANEKSSINNITTSGHILLAPGPLWKGKLKDHAALFPTDLVLNDVYVDLLTEQQWEMLAQNRIVRLSPLYSSELECSREELELILRAGSEELNTEKQHTTVKILVTDLYYFDSPHEKCAMSGSRKSNKKTRQMLEFIFQCLLGEEAPNLQSQNVKCSCGEEHEIFPAMWLGRLRKSKWIHTKGDDYEHANTVNLSKHIEKGDAICKLLKEPEAGKLLGVLNVSAGDLLMNVITGGKDELKLEWNTAYTALLTSEITPQDTLYIAQNPQLIQKLREEQKNTEKIHKNQQVGSEFEAAFQQLFESEEYRAEGFTIKRKPFGSDYEIESDLVEDGQEIAFDVNSGSKKFLIELKSTSTNKISMTELQGSTAKDNPGNFVLCVYERGNEPGPATIESIKKKAKFVTDIGERVSTQVEKVQALNAQSEKTKSTDGDVMIEIDGTEIKYGIKKAVWDGGKTFDQFVEFMRK